MNEKKNDLYALKRSFLKKKREARNKILGTDIVDGTSMQRVYSEATKTRRAIKIEHFGSKSKASATKGQETSIEQKCKQLLDSLSLEYSEQKQIRYINVDFYLPKYNLAIECNGEYWHCDPVIYPNGPKNNIQRKNIEKDKKSEEVVLSKKINRLVLWEKDFNDLESLEKKIISFLSFLSEQKEIKSYDSNTWQIK